MTQLARPRARKGVCILAIGLSTLALAAAVALVVYEHFLLPMPVWYSENQTIVVAGTIGTEFVPLPVFEVLPKLFPERFPPVESDGPDGPYKGGWVAKYGFLERRAVDEPTIPSTGAELAGVHKGDPLRRRFPVGFSFSNFRPFMPDPGPVTFVGLACAGGHSNRMPDWGPSGKLIYGSGNTRLDLIGFFESFRATLLDKEPLPSVPQEVRQDYSITEGPDLTPQQQRYKLTMSSIRKAREVMRLPKMGSAEDFMVGLWLKGAHKAAEQTKMRDDLSATFDQLRTPSTTRSDRAGPSRSSRSTT